jgi:hypothetical protein
MGRRAEPLLRWPRVTTSPVVKTRLTAIAAAALSSRETIDQFSTREMRVRLRLALLRARVGAVVRCGIVGSVIWLNTWLHVYLFLLCSWVFKRIQVNTPGAAHGTESLAGRPPRWFGRFERREEKNKRSILVFFFTAPSWPRGETRGGHDASRSRSHLRDLVVIDRPRASFPISNFEGPCKYAV